MQLKISSITNLSDARFFSAIGADYLGFCFDALNQNNISLSNAKEIIKWLHEPFIVGEFGLHQTKEEIEFIAKEMELNEIQIPYEHPQKNEFSFYKFVVMDERSTVDSLQSTDLFVMKLKESDYKNENVKQFISNNKVFIETAFTKDNILSITEYLQPYGIQITCRKEEKTGFSSVDEYAEFLEIIGYS